MGWNQKLLNNRYRGSGRENKMKKLMTIMMLMLIVISSIVGQQDEFRPKLVKYEDPYSTLISSYPTLCDTNSKSVKFSGLDTMEDVTSIEIVTNMKITNSIKPPCSRQETREGRCNAKAETIRLKDGLSFSISEISRVVSFQFIASEEVKEKKQKIIIYYYLLTNNSKFKLGRDIEFKEEVIGIKMPKRSSKTVKKSPQVRIVFFDKENNILKIVITRDDKKKDMLVSAYYLYND